jgi:protein-tyrosine-phosphatase
MRILFLCTGNICRSPMAEAIARAELAAGRNGIEVASAGIAALEGWSATSEAIAVAAEHGLSLAGHRARQLTPELVAATDVVVGMQREHAEYARRLGAGRATTLSSPVRDPYGLGIAAYRETWTLLAATIPELLGELDPARS